MIRISGGQARGRNLIVPSGQKTRPTSALVREAVFGMIQSRVANANVLDLFCGSGAYALEAISRGAASAVLIDSDSKAVIAARQNANALGYANIEVFQNDFLRALQILLRNDKKFDIIFLDPPYASDFYQTAINESKKVLCEDGCIVCEHPSTMALEAFDGGEILRQKRYGIRSITIFAKEEQH